MGSYLSIVQKTVWVSAFANILLAAVKFAIGGFFGSLALISDGAHSLSDLFSDLAVYVGTKMGSKPPDRDHHYGHGRFETFGELVLAFLLLGAGVGIIGYGVRSIIRQHQTFYGTSVALAAVLSVGVKEALYRWTRRWGRRTGSRILLVNAWHHRTDAFSSIAVLAGALFSRLGFGYADAVVGMLVGGMICVPALKFIAEAVWDLSESSPGHELEKRISGILEDSKEVRSYHNLRIRKLGSQLFMDMHVMVNPHLSLKAAHAISTRLEETLKQTLGENTSIVIHVEPAHENHVDP